MAETTNNHPCNVLENIVIQSHFNTTVMMRIYHIFYWKAVYTYGAGWSVQITAFKTGAEKQRVRGRTSSLFYGINLDEKWHIFSNLSMERAEGISRLQYLEMLHTWAYLWENSNVQGKRRSPSQEYSSTLKILRICVATDTGSWYSVPDTSEHSTCTFVRMFYDICLRQAV